MLEASRVSYRVGGRDLVREVSLDMQPGRVTVLIGPNGAGKTMLLRLLAGELAPSLGQVRLDGIELGALQPAVLGCGRAVVPQASALAFPFTVREVAMLGATVPGFAIAAGRPRRAADLALEAVGLAALAGRLYVRLSGGEKQRVHIARALCQLASAPDLPGRTRYFLLDEPTSSLDLAHQELVLGAIRRQADAGCAVLVVLHDLNLASSLADELVLMAGGRIAASGPPRSVLQDGPLTAAYGCPVHVDRVPEGDRPFVLPPAMLR
jgi:iron complex transport system ATP-binding protein